MYLISSYFDPMSGLLAEYPNGLCSNERKLFLFQENHVLHQLKGVSEDIWLAHDTNSVVAKIPVGPLLEQYQRQCQSNPEFVSLCLFTSAQSTYEEAGN